MHNWRTPILVCLLLLGVAAKAEQKDAQAASYIARQQAQFAAVIAHYTEEIARMRQNFVTRIGAINILSDLLDEKLEAMSSRIEKIELLNEKSRVCMEAQSHNIPKAINAHAAITACAASCLSDLNKSLRRLESTQNNLKNYYDKKLKTFLSECENKHVDNSTNYTTCLSNTIDEAYEFTNKNKRTFETQLQQASCNAENRLKQGYACSFDVVYNTTFTVAEVNGLINDCIDNDHGCNNINVTGQSLEDVVNSSDFRNVSTWNPFIAIPKLFHLNNTILQDV